MDQHQIVVDTAKAAPPVGVYAASHVFGMTLPELLNWLTFVYLLCLLTQMGWRFYKFGRDERRWWGRRKYRDRYPWGDQ